MPDRTPLAPQLAILASTILWGTLWIPLRQLRELGPGGEVWTAIGFAIPLGLLLPVAVRRGHASLSALRELAAAGFWLALGIALYAEGVARGEVARVILLFYLTPVWSTLLARVVLGDAITRGRLVTLALGLVGMFVIFGSDGGYPLPGSSADWMGLAAGLAWAVALVASRRCGKRPSFDRLFAHFVFLGPVFFAVTLVPDGAAPSGFEWLAGPQVLVWVFALALVWMLPVIWLTLIAASRVSPGRFAILLMFEIVVGLTTAGLLTEERMTSGEYVGACLIVTAIGAELLIERGLSGVARR